VGGDGREIVSVATDPITLRVTTTYKEHRDGQVPSIIKENTFTAERGGTYFVRAQGFSQRLVPREQAMREIVRMVERPSELREAVRPLAGATAPVGPAGEKEPEVVRKN